MPRFGFKVAFLLLLDLLLLGASLWHTRYLLNRARVPFLLDEVRGSVVVDDVLDTSAAPDLARGFVLRTMDGTDIRDYHDVEFLADLRSIGETVQVAGEEGGVGRSVTVRLVPFYSLRYAIISLLIGIVTLATAIFVLLARPGDRTARVMHAGLASLAFVVMLMWGGVVRGDPWTILSRTAYFVFYIGAAANFLYLTLLFPRRAEGLTRSSVVLLHGVALCVTAVALATHLQAILTASLESYRLSRICFDFYRGTILLYALLGVWNFVRSYRATESPEEQKKLQWLLWGLAIGPAPFLLLEVLPELFIPLSPVPEEYTLVFLLIIPGSFAVSFIRYHILDIRLVINRTTVYGIVLGGFVGTYLAVVAGVSAIIGQYTVGASVVSALLVALGLEPMRRLVQHAVDRRFFRVRYDFRLAQREFVEEMKKQHAPAGLARFVVERVQRLIPAGHVAFIQMGPEGGKPVCLAEVPLRQFGEESGVFADVRTWLVEDRPYALHETIEPGVPQVPTDPARLEGSGIALLIPMFSSGNTLLAFLALGGKKSGTRFSSEDIDLLRFIAAQAGLELDRITLQREVFSKEVETRQLRQINELKSAFVENVTHEFGNPLQAIQSHADNLGRMLGGSNRAGLRNIATITGEVERLQRLVTNILDAGRIEKGVVRYAVGECELGEIVRSVLRGMAYQLRENGFAVRTTGLGRGKTYPIRADREAIGRAITNLIGNAIKYSGERKKLTISLGAGGRFWRCAVRDRGVGIPPESLERIFERYYRAPSGNHTGGIGLGLSLVKEVMEAHGGRVEVESIFGEGSCFTLWIPRSRGGRRGGRRLRRASRTQSA